MGNHQSWLGGRGGQGGGARARGGGARASVPGGCRIGR